MQGSAQGTAPKAHRPAGIPLSLPGHGTLAYRLNPAMYVLAHKSGSEVLQPPYTVMVKTPCVCS